MLDSLLLSLPGGVWIYLGVQILHAIPLIITAVKTDPNPNKVSVKNVMEDVKETVTSRIQRTTVGEAEGLK